MILDFDFFKDVIVMQVMVIQFHLQNMKLQ